MPHTNVKTEWVDGDLVFYDKSKNEIFRVDGTNRKLTFASGAVLDVDAAADTITMAAGEVAAADLGANLKTGFIPLDITTPRIILADAIQNTTEAGVPDGNTAGPKLERINGATDKGIRLTWAATEVNEVQFTPFAYPPDLDDSAAVEVHLLAKMAAGGMDTPAIAVAYFEGVGDTNAGGNTSALSTTLAEKTVTIAAGDVGAHPTFATVTLIPAAHANEALELYAAWIEYTRRT